MGYHRVKQIITGLSALLLFVLLLPSFSLGNEPGDVNGDGQVCMTDYQLLITARNQPADGPDDPRDIDGDGIITVLDARKLILLCDQPRCVCVELPANAPPIANAGPDQSLVLAQGQSELTVTLDGSGSADTDGTIASYTWSGSPDPASTAQPVVNLGSGTHTFTLVVTDDEGAQSAPDSVQVVINPAANQRPVAAAGIDRTLTLPAGFDTITTILDGSGSYDPDGDLAVYVWSGDPDPADGLQPSATLGVGSFSFSLVVTDTEGLSSAPDQVTITVEAANTGGPPQLHLSPSQFFIEEGGTLSFSVTAEDPDGDTMILSASPRIDNAEFSSTPGSPVSGIFEISPDFSQQGRYAVAFKARDTWGNTSTATALITVVQINRPPQISVPYAISVDEGQLVTIPIQVSDPDDDDLMLTADGLPAVNAVLFPAARMITFAPDFEQAGSYSVTCSVDDGTADPVSAVVEITVHDVEGGASGEHELALEVDPVESPTLLTSSRITGTVNSDGSAPPVESATVALITSLEPVNGAQGQTLDVVISASTGGDYVPHFVQGLSQVDFGADIEINSVSVSDDTQAVVNITISEDAAEGARAVRVVTDKETAVAMPAFSVTRGQAEVSGVLVDPDTGLPISGALVTVAGTDITTTTSGDGSFTLIDIVPGTIMLIINAVNYELITLELGAAAGVTTVLGDIEFTTTVFDAAAAPSVSLYSVMGRRFGELTPTMGIAEAMQLITDAVLLVGGAEAGVLDEYGNQLNPLVENNGLITLTYEGVRLLAEKWVRGEESVTLGELLFAFSNGFQWSQGTPFTLAQWLNVLQTQVNAAWQDPGNPNNYLPILLFNKGATFSFDPPQLSPLTRLNPLQAYLFAGSLYGFILTPNEAITTGSLDLSSASLTALAKTLSRQLVYLVADFLVAPAYADETETNRYTRFWRMAMGAEGDPLQLDTQSNYLLDQFNTAYTDYLGTVMSLCMPGSLIQVSGNLMAKMPLLGVVQERLLDTYITATIAVQVPEPPPGATIEAEVETDNTGRQRVNISFTASASQLADERSYQPYIYSLYRYATSTGGRTRVATRYVVKEELVDTANRIILQDTDPLPLELRAVASSKSWFYTVTVTRLSRPDYILDDTLLDNTIPWWTLPLQGTLASLGPFNYRTMRTLVSDYSVPVVVTVDATGVTAGNEFEVNPLTGEIFVSDAEADPPKIDRIYKEKGVEKRELFVNTGFKKNSWQPGQTGLAVDSNGHLYTDNTASDAQFGGRLFKFSQPAGSRELTGTINYFSQLLMTANPVSCGPMSMGPGGFGSPPASEEDLFVVDNLSGYVKRAPVNAPWTAYQRVAKAFSKIPYGTPLDLEVTPSDEPHLLVSKPGGCDEFAGLTIEPYIVLMPYKPGTPGVTREIKATLKSADCATVAVSDAVTYEWVGSGIVDTTTINAIIDWLTEKIAETNNLDLSSITIPIADIDITDTGEIITNSGGVQIIRAKIEDPLSGRIVTSNPVLLLAGLEISGIALNPESTLNLLTNVIYDALQQALPEGSMAFNAPAVLSSKSLSSSIAATDWLGNYLTNSGKIILQDITFTFLDNYELSVAAILDGPIMKLLQYAVGKLGLAGFLAERAVTFLKLVLAGVAQEFLPLTFESDDTEIAGVPDAWLGKGVVEGGAPGLTVVQGTLDFNFWGLGTAADGVPIFVLPRMDRIILEPAQSALSLSDPYYDDYTLWDFAGILTDFDFDAFQEKVVSYHYETAILRVLGEVLLAHRAQFEIPEAFLGRWQDWADLVLPGGLSLGSAGELSIEYGLLQFKFTIQGSISSDTNTIYIDDLAFGFTLPSLWYDVDEADGEPDLIEPRRNLANEIVTDPYINYLLQIAGEQANSVLDALEYTDFNTYLFHKGQTGEAFLKATYSDAILGGAPTDPESCKVVVTGVDHISVEPAEHSINLDFDTDKTVQFSARTLMEPIRDITSEAQWESFDTTVAEIGNDAGSKGLATARSAGTVSIMATWEQETGVVVRDTARINVVEVASISVEPALAVVNIDLDEITTQQFTATAQFTDGTTMDVTSLVQWQSGNPDAATVNTTGLAQASIKGRSWITAVFAKADGTSLSGSGMFSLVNVTAIDVQPESAKINLDLDDATTVQLMATGRLSDSTEVDLTRKVTWNSFNDEVAGVLTTGLVQANMLGEAVIQAEFVKSSGTSLNGIADISVVEITAIDVQPDEVVINVDLDKTLTQQFTATAQLSDNTTMDVTTEVEWASSDDTVAAVNGVGLVQALVLGNTSVTAVFTKVSGSSLSDNTPVGVVEVTALTVYPAETVINLDLDTKTTHQFVAIGTLSDNTSADLTSDASWTSSDTDVAWVNATGLAGAVEVGETEITAGFTKAGGGLLTDSGMIKVVNIDGLTVTPDGETVNIDLDPDLTVTYRATAALSNGETQDVTDKAVWTSSNAGIATVDGAGLATAQDSGICAISATVTRLDGADLSDSADLTVVEVVSLTVEPAQALVDLSHDSVLSRQFTATAELSDGDHMPVTQTATWQSSASTFVSIVAPGSAQALAAGGSVISATLAKGSGGSVSDTAYFSVISDADLSQVTAIKVMPETATVFLGSGDSPTQQYTVRAILPDESEIDLHDRVTWSAEPDTVATISPATGLAEGIGTGTALIRATLILPDSTAITGEAELIVDDDL